MTFALLAGVYLKSRTSLLALALLGAASSTAFSQSYSAFNATTSIFGVGVTHTGMTYTVSLSSGAYLMMGGTHYDITNIFGFWSVSGTHPLSGSGTTQHNWSFNSKTTGGGYTAGWTDPSKGNDIVVGGHQSFTYAALTQPNVEQYGFHFSLAQNFGSGNTAFFRGQVQGVPEPSSYAVGGLCLAALVHRRKKLIRPYR
jgi:hypothetical protein